MTRCEQDFEHAVREFHREGEAAHEIHARVDAVMARIGAEAAAFAFRGESKYDQPGYINGPPWAEDE